MKKLVIAAIAAATLPMVAALPVTAQQATPPQTQPGASQSNPAINLSPDQIKQLQQALNDNGFDAGEVDGRLSAQTSNALRKFQTRLGIEPTGRVDAQTLKAVGMADKIPAGEPASTGQGGAAPPAPAEEGRASGEGGDRGQPDSAGPQNAPARN
jgi:peptidoglycan hydrolase-like protein with peptidoglycan-binding domain